MATLRGRREPLALHVSHLLYLVHKLHKESFPCRYISHICKEKIILNEWTMKFTPPENLPVPTREAEHQTALNSQNCFQISCFSI